MSSYVAPKPPMYQRRGAFFCGAVLIVTMAGAYLQMGHRRTKPLDTPENPPGWQIAFQVPSGWADRGSISGDRHAQMRMFVAPAGNRYLLFGRLFVDPTMSAGELGRELIAAEAVDGYHIPLAEIRVSERRVDEWPAAEVDWQPGSAGPMSGMHVQILSMVTSVVDAEGQQEAYVVQLHSRGTRPVRDAELWSRLIAAVKIVTP